MTVLQMNIPVIETKRLVLREPRLEDLDALIHFLGSDHTRFVGGPMTPADACRSLYANVGHWMMRGYGFWVIADKCDGTFLGRVGFLFATGWHETELGWQVTEAAQGRGIAFEAAKAARAYGAAQMGLEGVISYIDPANTRSRALVERLGCVHERDVTFFGKDGIGIWRHPKAEAT